MGTIVPASPFNRAATSSNAFCLRPQMMTVAPSRANISAVACPIPRLPPVTIATLFLSWLIRSVDSHLQLLQVLAERPAEIVTPQRKLHRGLQEAQLVAGIVARPFEAVTIDRAILR